MVTFFDASVLIGIGYGFAQCNGPGLLQWRRVEVAYGACVDRQTQHVAGVEGHDLPRRRKPNRTRLPPFRTTRPTYGASPPFFFPAVVESSSKLHAPYTMLGPGVVQQGRHVGGGQPQPRGLLRGVRRPALHARVQGGLSPRSEFEASSLDGCAPPVVCSQASPLAALPINNKMAAFGAAADGGKWDFAAPKGFDGGSQSRGLRNAVRADPRHHPPAPRARLSFSRAR